MAAGRAYGRRMKTALLSLALIAAAGAPGVATAATVTSDGGTVTYTAAVHEVNSPALVATMPITLTDATAPLTAGTGCVSGPPVSCPFATDLSVLLGDRADTTNLDSAAGNVTIDGGTGDDRITGGSVNRVTVTGAGGDDTITVNANALGTGDGGPGADSLLGTSGGNVLTGGDGADLITNRGSRFTGGTLDGGNGPDRIVGNGSAVLTGDAGNDILVTQGDGESADGGANADKITSVVGGATIAAGAGADMVDAADGSGVPDTITCGSGSDVVWADPGDAVASDCELVLPGPAPALPGTAQAIADAAALS
jgi:Ca2+-binding RTX toxin-like protein